MINPPEYLPPRWRDSMRLRRSCLLHFDAERTLSQKQAGKLADGLAADHGKGKWHCQAVQLDGRGREWEFRFTPMLASVRQPRPGPFPSN